MDELLLSQKTKRSISALVADPAQSLLVVGQLGSGRTTAAKAIVAELLKKPISQLEGYAYLTIVSPDGQSVKIEQVQKIKSLLKLKTPPSEHKLRRFIIIESANLMTRDAQNAALKFIEEPPLDTMIMLIVEHERDVLATIQSRCAVLRIGNPGQQEATDYASKHGLGKSQTALSQYQLSGGRAGLFLALLTNSDHPLVQAMARAKGLLRAPTGERLIAVDELSKDKQLTAHVLFALDRIAQVGLTHAKPEQIKRWHKILSALEAADTQLAANTNTKLVLTNLMLSL